MSNYEYRYIANVVIEAVSPLKIGSSHLDMLQDAPVQKDFNNLPMILGTSIAGALRKEFNEPNACEIFGDEKGSRLIVSNALLCDENMQVHEKLLLQKSPFLQEFDLLPQREHTAISEKGVAVASNKFDEEVVYKGTRFRFRLEFLANSDDKEAWMEIVKALNADSFRLGGGVTKGFGEIQVRHELSTFDFLALTSQEYKDASSSLNTTYSKQLSSDAKESTLIKYELAITPDDFFIFGSGFGDDNVDATPVYESVVSYEQKRLLDKQVLMPASSIKGAISHRTAFHYNRLTGANAQSGDAKVGEENEAVKAIFGFAKDGDKTQSSGAKGKLLMSDCFMLDKNETKAFDHVAIDRFTGGALESALFNEETIAQKDDWHFTIYLDAQSIEEKILKAFELSLVDITTGMLPLGGMTTKGHGVFSGTIFKDGIKYEE